LALVVRRAIPDSSNVKVVSSGGVGAHSARLELRHLRRCHAGARVPAVSDFCFAVDAGELVTLLGPSGCGKSTVLRMVAGFEPLDGGHVFIDGADVSGMPPSERPVSLVFQSYALFPHLSVLDNVAFGLRAQREPIEGAHEALALVNLQQFAGRSPSQLSGGQQQRVALARALALRPRVLLLDEPLSNLDEALRRQMRDQIRGLQKQLGLTLIYVTHDQSEAMAVSDRVVVMREGVIEQAGSPRALYERPVNAFVAGFMGEARVYSARAGSDGVVRIGASLVLPYAERLSPGEVQVMVRPQAWQVLAPASQGLAQRLPWPLRGVHLRQRHRPRVRGQCAHGRPA
jgi:iron(III) transport system ATP-binding protein